ncbi:hypothetical protein V5799_025038, partial [Amblyomma americanum]
WDLPCAGETKPKPASSCEIPASRVDARPGNLATQCPFHYSLWEGEGASERTWEAPATRGRSFFVVMEASGRGIRHRVSRRCIFRIRVSCWCDRR